MDAHLFLHHLHTQSQNHAVVPAAGFRETYDTVLSHAADAHEFWAPAPIDLTYERSKQLNATARERLNPDKVYELEQTRGERIF